MSSNVLEVARAARRAALELASLDTAIKNRALEALRGSLGASRGEILAANAEDKREALRAVEAGTLSRALWKRLDLEGAKLEGLLAGVDEVARLPDPVGEVQLATRLDDGLELYRVSCPIGVLGVIFEARPDAAVQISTLALKSSNAVILKGGREADRTNRALVDAMRRGLATVPGIPVDAIQLISTREEVREMLALDQYIDLLIPRGSNELVRSIKDSTRIPVLGHADGICAVYLDRAADPARASDIVADAKAQYPAACNAAETLLVHREALARVLPGVARRLSELKVAVRADVESLPYFPGATPASEADFRTEFLDLVLAVKTVGSLDEAIRHINEHGSHHTDAIVTEDRRSADEFLARVDSAGVYHNASTRFADGFRYGFGAEVGISTNKTHARGPVGLEGLVIHKYLLRGNGHTVASYGPGGRRFLHEPLPRRLSGESREP